MIIVTLLIRVCNEVYQRLMKMLVEIDRFWLFVKELCLPDHKRLRLMARLLSGMTSRDFKGIPSLQEVECLGGSLKPELKLLSLKIYTVTDSAVLASLNVLTRACLTYADFSSCYVNTSDTHKSRLRVLVPDLREGESREYGCKVNALTSEGDTKVSTWSIFVTRRSECIHRH